MAASETLPKGQERKAPSLSPLPDGYSFPFPEQTLVSPCTNMLLKPIPIQNLGSIRHATTTAAPLLRQARKTPAEARRLVATMASEHYANVTLGGGNAAGVSLRMESCGTHKGHRTPQMQHATHRCLSTSPRPTLLVCMCACSMWPRSLWRKG